MTKGNGKEKRVEREIREFMEAPDELAEGFTRDTTKVPLIEMSEQFKKRSVRDRMKYWHKLASSLNHCCQKIQSERDELNSLCFQKEAQITQLRQDSQRDRAMIQNTLARINREKQDLTSENQGLYAEIKQLTEQLEELRDNDDNS